MDNCRSPSIPSIVTLSSVCTSERDIYFYCLYEIAFVYWILTNSQQDDPRIRSYYRLFS